jgi:hypothetical protein
MKREGVEKRNGKLPKSSSRTEEEVDMILSASDR